MKPANPYKPGTNIWAVMEGDWEDLTSRQIGEVLGCSPFAVSSYISKIRKQTGYAVPHTRARRGPKPAV